MDYIANLNVLQVLQYSLAFQTYHATDVRVYIVNLLINHEIQFEIQF